ncbi:MAG: acetyltransferase [Flavobacteriales bacterium]
MNRKIAIVGYSGHATVIEDALLSADTSLFGYFEQKEKPGVKMQFLGSEKDNLQWIRDNDFIVAIGDNALRAKIYNNLLSEISYVPSSVIHSRSYISKTAQLGNYVQVLTHAVIHPYAKVGKGTICNTASLVEHECEVGDFCHIAVGAVLCGNVKVGDYSFVGAGAVVRPGITIGANVTIGAGAVIVKDVPDNSTVVGNPMRYI